PVFHPASPGPPGSPGPPPRPGRTPPPRASPCPDPLPPPHHRRRRRLSSFLHHDFGKIGQSRKFFLNRAEEGKAVAPQLLLRSVDEHVDEEPVERGRDRGDHPHGVPVATRARELLDRLARRHQVRGELPLRILAVEIAGGGPGRPTPPG